MDLSNTNAKTFCTNCGNELRPNAKFCVVCGTSVEAMATSTPAEQPVEAVETVENVETAEAVENVEKAEGVENIEIAEDVENQENVETVEAETTTIASVEQPQSQPQMTPPPMGVPPMTPPLMGGQPQMTPPPMGGQPQGQPQMTPPPMGVPPMTPPPMGGQSQGQPQPQPQAYAQQPYGQPYAAPQQPSAAGIYFKKLVDTFISILKTPSSHGKAFAAAGDYKIAAGYIVIQAIVTMIFALLTEIRLLGSYGSFGGYAVAFFGTLFFSLLFSVALSGAILGANLIAKNDISFATAVGIVATRSVYMIPATMVSLIVMLIIPSAGIGLLFFASICTFVLMVKANPVKNAESEDLLTQMQLAALLVYVIVAVFLSSKIGFHFYFM